MKKYKWLLLALSPYFVLIAILLLNPFLQKSNYCPLPTVFERGFGIFPSVVGYWGFYAVGILFVEFALIPVLLTISGIFIGVVSIFRKEKRAAAWRRLFLGLPFTTLVVGILVLLGLFFLLDSLGLGWGAYDIVSITCLAVFGILILASVIWLVVAGIIERRSDDPNVKRRGTHTLLAAVVGLISALSLPAYVMIASLNSARGGIGAYDSAVVPMAGAPSMPNFAPKASSIMPEFGSTIGFSVGGAKDADNFRENIAQCYLPIPTDITYEGLFYDYHFDTKNESGCTALFCPQYEAAIIADPYSKKDEYFLSVGLASNISERDFARPPLDLVVVLDISGSMSSSFDKYHYDRFRVAGPQDDDKNDWDTSKMEIAKESVSALVDHLHADDRFGMVVFDNTADELLPAHYVGDGEEGYIKDMIATLSPRGGTNMEAGLLKGTELLESLPQDETVDRERRIIFLTDAMPNTGALEENELYRIGKVNATEGMHTTFIGIGVDFNTELVEALTKKIRGANYYAIHSSSGFQKRLDEEFEYMVAPLVYDLTLNIEGGDYEIREVYGTPEANEATGDIIKVSTLFPSPTTEGESRGGVIVAHLKKVKNSGAPMHIMASYEDRAGEKHQAVEEVRWKDVKKQSASENVRKAVLLARYANLMQNWIIDENLRLGPHEKTIYIPITPHVFYDNGLMIPSERYVQEGATTYIPVELSYWERLSRSLMVSKDYKKLFADFTVYMKEESRGIEESLDEEIEILENLVESPDPPLL